MIQITDISDNRINHFRELKKIANDNTFNEFFVAEGEKVVLKLLNSDLQIISMFSIEDFYFKNKELIDNRINDNNQIFTADKGIMSQIIGYKMHSGIMAFAVEKNKTPIEKLDKRIIILNNIVDTENVGSIIRNAAAFDFGSIIYDNATSSPYLRRAVRVSLGNIFSRKHYKSENLIQDIEVLKKMGYMIISAEITKNSYPIYHFDFPEKFVVIFGNEGNGVDAELLEMSDYIVHIPIMPNVDSINVAASSAVFMYDIQNSRSKLCLKI